MSNIAWKPSLAESYYDILKHHGIKFVEVAPSLLFQGDENYLNPSELELNKALDQLKKFGLSPCSMQSLFYGRNDVQLFCTSNEYGRFISNMRQVLMLADRLGVRNVVFGCPGNRSYPSELGVANAYDHAAEVFYELAKLCKETGCIIAIEANPVDYGTNFLNDFEQTASFVDSLNLAEIKMNLDLGALKLNDDYSRSSLRQYAGLVNHLHISEPFLAPAPADAELVREIISELRFGGYRGHVSLEMRPVDDLRLFEKCIEDFTAAARSVN